MTEHDIMQYNSLYSNIMNRAYELVSKNCSENISNIVFTIYKDEILLNYYNGSNIEHQCIKIKDFCDPEFSIGEIRKYH